MSTMNTPARPTRPNAPLEPDSDRVFGFAEDPNAWEAHDPNRLATHLQAKSENYKADLSREIHDDLGSLMVASAMDAASAEQHLPPDADESRRKLQRLRQSLDEAIDLKQRIVEHLRPTLLDNMGLFAALGWLLKNYRTAGGLRCSQKFPATEPPLTARASIGLFRFIQEALQDVTGQFAQSVELNLFVTDAALAIFLTHDGKPGAGNPDLHSLELESLKHRIHTLGGELDIVAGPAVRSTLRATVPLGAITRCGAGVGNLSDATRP